MRLTPNATKVPPRSGHGPLRQTRPDVGPDGDGDRVRGDHPHRRAEPRADGVVGGGQRHGREHRLVAELGEEERGSDGHEHATGRSVPACAARVVVASSSSSPRRVHAANPRERGAWEARKSRRSAGRRRRSLQGGPYRVHDGGRDRDREQDRHRPVPGREGHRHQLALVAELGDEDDAEGNEEGFHRAPSDRLGSGFGGTRLRPDTR